MMSWEGAAGEVEMDLARVLVAMVETIRGALGLEAELQIEGGRLSADQVGRLRRVIAEMDRAVEHVKAETGVWVPGAPWGDAPRAAVPWCGSGPCPGAT